MCAEIGRTAKKDTGNETLVFRKTFFDASSHAYSCVEPTASSLSSYIWLLTVFLSS